MGKYAEYVVNINNISNQSSKAISLNKLQRDKNKLGGKTNKAVSIVAMWMGRGSEAVFNKVGAYTGNKVSASNRQERINLGSLAIASFLNPFYGIGSLALHTFNNAIDYNIRNKNSQEESNYRTSLLGNMATSKSRWRGYFK